MGKKITIILEEKKKKKNTPTCLHCAKLWPICTTVSVHGNHPLWQIPEDCDSYLRGASKRGTYGKKLAYGTIYIFHSPKWLFSLWLKKKTKKEWSFLVIEVCMHEYESRKLNE